MSIRQFFSRRTVTLGTATLLTSSLLVACGSASSETTDASAIGSDLDPAGTLAEIAATVATAPGVADRAAGIAARLGLTPVRCRDRAGFIVDALRFPYLNDAAAMLGAGYADADSIDAAMTLGCGYPTGPIADLDRLGLDRAVAVLRALHAETREPALAPVPLLTEHVAAGRPLR